MGRIGCLGLALAALALTAPPAASAPQPFSLADLSRAIDAANATWHSPCNGRPTITSQPLSDNHLAMAGLSGCWIILNSKKNISARALCDVMVHEFGHLAKAYYPNNVDDPYHSPNPRSVMYAAFKGDEVGGVWDIAPKLAAKRCR